MKDNLTYLGNAHTETIDALYQQYKTDPESVDFGWRKFFEGFDFQKTDYSENGEISANTHREFKVLNLINDYRFRGHLFTSTNPVRERRKYEPTLDLENYGLSKDDLNDSFQAGSEIGIGTATLKEIIAHLQATYCKSIGIEYAYIRQPQRFNWIKERIELKNRPEFTEAQKKQILKKINQATIFEQFLQKKFVGQKRFSIEGGEALIPALDALIEGSSEAGVKEFVIGMAHRGRLNTLAHILDKPYDQIFNEFYGKGYEGDDVSFDGDVKYHLGHTTNAKTDSGKEVRITLCPNPSHLEAVDPVVEGLGRAKIDHVVESEKELVPILVHGDAAISGQGVIYELVQMAGLDGYRTGGTIHIVVNNQVGFTTNYLDGRTSTYCTDIAKATLCPVFHVNGDDIEAVVQTVKMALDYRQEFNKDVFIDLLGYRKYGHNEGDEPKFTQPKLYKAIAAHDTPRDLYLGQLISEGVVDEEYGEKIKADLEKILDKNFEAAKKQDSAIIEHFLKEEWKDFKPSKPSDFDSSPQTGFDLKKLKALAKKINTIPTDKNFFRKIKKLMNDRLKMIDEDSLDWGTAETLAYATLLEEGHPVRISGQDVERGTFSHRHAVLKTEENEEEYLPLNNISKKQAKFSIYNSLLSEYGVLGFEYGYAYGVPNGLTIWEAQFGDFNNGAQIIIDQFISASEDKWRAMNGLVMLLPHGYEGMGSEHSSGRMERYLQMCADYNMQICNCTTPANFFHLLRRQMKRSFKKPLIVFTPKKLLRYPKAVSKMSELSKGKFLEIIDDSSVVAKNVKTVVFCSGKVYYDVLEEKELRKKGNDMALVRLEQIFPLPEKQMAAIIKKYGANCQYIWLQEEPANMGAWSFIKTNFDQVSFELISRRASGSPAAGSPTIHQSRYTEMMDKLFKHTK